jgi:hypothetical protein
VYNLNYTLATLRIENWREIACGGTRTKRLNSTALEHSWFRTAHGPVCCVHLGMSFSMQPFHINPDKYFYLKMCIMDKTSVCGLGPTRWGNPYSNGKLYNLNYWVMHPVERVPINIYIETSVRNKCRCSTNVGARFIVHFLHYMFRPLLVAIFRWFL